MKPESGEREKEKGKKKKKREDPDPILVGAANSRIAEEALDIPLKKTKSRRLKRNRLG